MAWATLRARSDGVSKAGVLRHPKGTRGVIPRKTSSSSQKVFDQSQHKLMFLSPFIEFFPLKFDGFSEGGDMVMGQCGEL